MSRTCLISGLVLLLAASGLARSTDCRPGPEMQGACILSLESALQQRHPGRIRREPDALLVLASNGRAARFVISSEGVQATSPYVIDWLEPIGQAVVWTSLWEGRQVTLVDLQDGSTRVLAGLPLLSPDGRWLAVHSAALETNYSANRLEIHRVEGRQLRLEFVLDGDADPAHSWAPERVRWLAPTQLAFDRARWQDNVRQSSPQLLRLGAQGWALQPEMP